MTFASNVRTDFTSLTADQGISVTVRSRTLSSYDGSDEITYSTADNAVTALWLPKLTQKEMFNLAGREVDATHGMLVAYDTTIDENDRVVLGDYTYDIIQIIDKGTVHNPLCKAVLLKKIRGA